MPSQCPNSESPTLRPTLELCLQEQVRSCQEKALKHSRNAAEIASMLVQVAAQQSAEARLKSLDFSLDSCIAQQLSPAAAAQALGDIGWSCSDVFCQVEISNGHRAQGEAVGHAVTHHTDAGGCAPAAAQADAAPALQATPAAADIEELQLTEIETALQQQLHGTGLVVGFRLWQLFRQLLRDKELMKVCEWSDTT